MKYFDRPLESLNPPSRFYTALNGTSVAIRDTIQTIIELEQLSSNDLEIELHVLKDSNLGADNYRS